MSIFSLLRSRHWVLGRRLALVLIIVILGFRSYGGSITSWLQGSSGSRDVVLTRFEFQPDTASGKPIWIIGLKNSSTRYTYERVELKASYKDAKGNILQSDKLVVRQRLGPGDEQLLASPDIKERPGATAGVLEVTGAASVSP